MANFKFKVGDLVKFKDKSDSWYQRYYYDSKTKLPGLEKYYDGYSGRSKMFQYCIKTPDGLAGIVTGRCDRGYVVRFNYMGTSGSCIVPVKFLEFADFTIEL